MQERIDTVDLLMGALEAAQEGDSAFFFENYGFLIELGIQMDWNDYEPVSDWEIAAGTWTDLANAVTKALADAQEVKGGTRSRSLLAYE